MRTADGGSSPGSGLGDLRAAGAVGALEPAFAAALTADPLLFAQVVRVLLDANFAPSLHPDICAAVGLDVEAAELARAGASVLRYGTVRSPAFRTEVLIAYEYRCAFCGFDGFLGGTAVGLDAAHVRWWAHGGPDDVANGLCLCALHHKLFDKGVLGLAEDRTVTVSTRFVGRSAASASTVLDLVGQPMLSPQTGYPDPDAAHVEWHLQEVFKSPARAVPVT